MNYDSRNPESCRLRQFVIANDTLIAILRDQVEVVPDQLPKDAEITWVISDLFTRRIGICVWSSEFDVVPDGVTIPDCGLIEIRSVPNDEVKPSDSGESSESGESWRQRPSLFQ